MIHLPGRFGPRGWRRPWLRLSLRARLTVISAAGLAVGLAVGGLVLLGALGYALQRTVDTEALKTAEAVARLAGQNALPDPLPVAGGQVRVQVLDGQGRIRAASIDADRLVPMLYPDELRRFQSGDRDRFYLPGRRLGLDGPIRVVAVPAGPAADPQTVLVAKSTADVRHSVTVVRTILLVSFPLLLLGLAAVAWRVIGATLRPVETLRAGAEEITGGARPGRLPLPASHDEIHRLAVTLNGMLGRLESARARQRAFVADAAHELRSPLANMRTQLEVAQRLGPATEWPAVADDLLADTQRLSRLVDDLLLLARFDEGTARPPRAAEPVELGELLTEVAERYPAAPLRVVAPRFPLWVLAEPDALARILGNLLDNAVRHTTSEVALEAGPGGWTGPAYHLVTVTDDGPGIPAGDRDRVFDRFTRLDDARARDAGGAGLGLAIVRELVRRQGGTVTLGDAGPGLRVEVRLPAERPAPDGPDERVPTQPVSGVQPAEGDLPGRSVQTGSASPTRLSE
ncbi:HAMP domain-containing sensor histidine kinase [Plantactinospora mayteni]|uniref:histidine kinase n=1 Tax=Plantactinospora mayteni TaxID=566021 RepID=A0ABQ4EH26_9ACTN|nr:HAMP domain-containing sensor histidine kinase [Plantactinospora mayteni]GIG94032.1 two-component sensor histidine kinase [Plantactinospora mayteni]